MLITWTITPIHVNVQDSGTFQSEFSYLSMSCQTSYNWCFLIYMSNVMGLPTWYEVEYTHQQHHIKWQSFAQVDQDNPPREPNWFYSHGLECTCQTPYIIPPPHPLYGISTPNRVLSSRECTNVCACYVLNSHRSYSRLLEMRNKDSWIVLENWYRHQ